MSNPELENGRIVSKVLKAIIPNYHLELHESNSAVNRMNNWNNLMYLCANVECSSKLLGLL